MSGISHTIVTSRGSTRITTLQYLIVAGGGAGGPQLGGRGGGGGAGGYLTGNASVTSGNTYTITIGGSGSNSLGMGLTAIGGGAGGGTNGGDGGSGGGSGADFGQPGNGGAGTPGQGYSGSGKSGDQGGGGGGSAGGPGGINGATSVGAYYNGANNVYGFSAGYATGWFAGGGAADNSGLGYEYGGGGRSDVPFKVVGENGRPNTGGGGGGTHGDAYGGYGQSSGGSGIVILQYDSSKANLTSIDVGLTYSWYNSGGKKSYVFTGGTGNITI